MPEPLFILCPPRSYSSIVCGILGQHPDCYGLPELNLFRADDLGSLWRGPLSFTQMSKDGLLRTLSQLHEGKQTADTVIHAHEWVMQRFSWPVEKVFHYIQEAVGDKMLVEKSPSTVFRAEYVDRMIRLFPNANILHLTRHPRGTGESMMGLRRNFEPLQNMLNNNSITDPERIWARCHENIIASTSDLPLGQCMRIKGEALLADLDLYLPQICEWLGLRYDEETLEAMMHPEHSPYACPGPPGASYGNDPNFLENPAIDRARLARARAPALAGELSWRPGEVFTHGTEKLSKQLGYY